MASQTQQRKRRATPEEQRALDRLAISVRKRRERAQEEGRDDKHDA